MALRRITVLAVLMPCVVLLGWAATLPLAEPDIGIAGALAFLLAALVVTHIFVVRNSRDRLNLLSVTAAFYLLNFFFGGIYVWLSLPGGSHTPLDVTITQAGLTAAITLVAVAWLFCAAGYMISPLRLARAVWRPPSRLVPSYRIAPLVTVLLGLGWVARFVLVGEGNYYHIHTEAQSPTGVSWLVHTMSILPLVALALVATRAFAPEDAAQSRGARGLFAALFVGELAWAIPTGSREAIVIVVLMLVIVRYYTLGRLPSFKVAIPAILIFVFVVFPVLAAYRSSDFRASPVKALSTTIQQEMHFTNSQTAGAGEATLARVADVTALARIFQLGKNRMSLSTQDTVRYSLEGLVPRALFPDKLNSSAFANQFGRAYGFLASDDSSTAIAATQPGELYLGGGWIALLVGMAVIGALLRVMDEYLGARGTDRGVLALYAVAVPILLVGLESSIAIGFVGAIKATLVLGLVVAAVEWLLSHATANGPAQPRPLGG
jgi:hypothetical protein